MDATHEPPALATEILDALPFPALLIDERRRVIHANAASRTAFGDLGDGCDSLCRRLGHHDRAPLPECPLDEAIASGGAAEHVFHTEGDSTWLEAGIYPTGRRTAAGLRVYVHVLRDVSEARRAREASAASEERYRTLAEAADDQIYIIDADDRIDYVNVNAARQFGLTPADLIGRRQSDVFAPAVAERQRARIRDVLESGRSSRSESQVAFGDRTAWLDTVLVPLPGRDGKAQAVMGVSRDFTARKTAEQRMVEAEAATRSSEARLRHLLDTSPTVTYALDVRGKEAVATWMSDNVRRLFGVEPTEAMRPDWWVSHLHPDDLEAALRSIPDVLEAGHVTHEYRLAGVDGVFRWILDELRLIRDEAGEPREIIGAWLDITERKRAEAVLEEGERRLRISERMEAIGNLAGGIAHDFNNLLTAIGGYTDLLLEDPAMVEAGREELLEIRKAAARAGDLTNQLLAFSRRQTLRPAVLDINQVVGRMRRMLERVLGEDVRVTAHLDPELGFAEVDPSQLEQVILNLASNARGAMPDGGSLEFETANVVLDEEYAHLHPDAHPGAHIRLTVRDTGGGMDQETLSHAFEPFYTTKPQGQGTGLGLSSVYGITKQSGGHVTIESAPGAGTTMSIHLPRVFQSGATETTPAVASRSDRNGSETVLVVEDEPAVLGFVTRVLSELGYTPLSARDPQEAVNVAARHEGPIHLLLTDVMLPQKSGREVAAEMAGTRPDLRVLYMSGYAKDAMVRDGRLDEGISLLSKPFTRAELAVRIQQALEAGPPTAPPPDDGS